MNVNKNKGILIYFAIAIAILLFMVFGFRSLLLESDSTSYSDIIGYFDEYRVSE